MGWGEVGIIRIKEVKHMEQHVKSPKMWGICSRIVSM